MTLNNIKTMKKDRGFTIVELLIVIVVIAILAAITIVAYSGITSRANSAKALTNAESAQKVAESMNADNGSYPATFASFGTGSTSTKLPSGMSVIADASSTTINGGNGLTTVAYACALTCTAPAGGRIAYWDFSGSGTVKYVYVGSASVSTATWAYPTS